MLVDSHAHLDIRDFDNDRTDVIDRAVSGGLTNIITIGIDVGSSLRALELARKHAFIYASVGLHPHNANTFDSQELDSLAQIASDSKIVAWGEIGLDFYRRYSPRDDQLRSFQQQLETANDLDLPVIIHDRDAHDDVFKILKKMGKGEKKGVIHCYSGDQDLAAAFIELGYYISIPGTVTYKKASHVRDVASSIPMERMLIETDAPFLTPVPKRGKRNEPLFVTYTAQEIARLRNIKFEEVARKTAENAQTLFGLP
ncbi:MAG: TatD family hydrolase [Deltaproteobacteria bacterium]|nr:TatD family hydrolase [Deltaproteobacteria bacterium]MBW2142904.1 TatD family hydrolase [Deltaproteobacteria bacterium]